MKLILLLHKIVVAFGSSLDAAIGECRASEILFRHLELQYLILCEFFAKINTVQ